MYFIDLQKKGIPKITGKARCLQARYGKGIANYSGEVSGVLIKNSKGIRIRRLTPLECFRLQGFPDEYFYKAREVNSDTQLYRQAGNGVTVPVIYEMARRMGVNND